MNLYKILELHGAPKSHVTFVSEFILAETDEEVFEYLNKDRCWEENFEEGSFDSWEEMKQDLMENKGDLHSEEGWEDAYYGITKKGWECFGHASAKQIQVLTELGLLKNE